MSHTIAMIMAAGRGDRFGGNSRKQLAVVNGQPVLSWSISRLASNSSVAGIILVAPPGEEETMRKALENRGIERVDKIVAGGETRQESVRLGLQELPEETSHVIVHDAARPCLSEGLLNRVIDALKESPAVVPAVPVSDTLIREESSRVDAILDRVRISGVQTPQAFEKELLLRAHLRARAQGFRSSDDGSLALALGETVKTVPGDRTNIKITYPEDMVIVEAILVQTE
jgi:2-C-methyl-D-erythritol 4-phosphate cytidylyltransferase